MKKLIPLIFGIIFVLMLTGVSAGVYDLRNTSNAKGSSICIWYPRDVNYYPLSSYLNSAPYNDANLNLTNTSNDKRWSRGCGPEKSICHCLNVSITESPPLVNNITFGAEGYGNLNPWNRTEIYVYNASDLFELVSNDTSLTGTDNLTKHEITGDFTDYIHGTEIYFLYCSQLQNQSQPKYTLYVDFMNLTVTSALPTTETYQYLNDTYPHLGEALNFTVTVSFANGLNMSTLLTNESGEWKNVGSLYGGWRYLKNATTDTINYTWENASWCNRGMGLRLWYNTSNATEYYTDINVTYLLPYVNGTSGVRGNISSSSCDNTTHIELTWDQKTENWIELWIGKVMVGTNETCPYTASYVRNLTMRNRSDYCYVRGRLKDVEAGTVQHFYRTAALTFVRPPNVPAALALGTIVVIIVIYTVTRKYKSEEWE